jgi:hypothetical protein
VARVVAMRRLFHGAAALEIPDYAAIDGSVPLNRC